MISRNMNPRLAVLLLGVLLGISPASNGEQSVAATNTVIKRVDVQKYDQLRANTNNVILDVRSPAEFEKGHIPGAVNIDINSSKFSERITALDKSKPYLVNCAVGMRSAKACRKMEALGFKELYDLAPGFDGWQKAGKPVEK
jgi:rhodanese-related sulfurtransferase